MRDKKQATSDKPSDSLKPCPFCGGKAEVNLLLGNYGVTCTECMGSVFPARGMTKGEAIQAWNTRKPVDDVLDNLKTESETCKGLIELHSAAGNRRMAHSYAEKAKTIADVIEIVKENLT